MSEIPDGYRMVITDHGGTVLDVIDLEGYDLRHTLSAVDLGLQVMALIERHEREEEQ